MLRKKYDQSSYDPDIHDRNHPLRIDETGHIHFITTSCMDRKPLLSTSVSRQIVIDTIDEARAKKGFFVIGYVLMPEHAHFLIAPGKVHGISETMRLLKWYSSTRLLKALRAQGKTEKSFVVTAISRFQHLLCW